MYIFSMASIVPSARRVALWVEYLQHWSLMTVNEDKVGWNCLAALPPHVVCLADVSLSDGRVILASYSDMPKSAPTYLRSGCLSAQYIDCTVHSDTHSYDLATSLT